MNLHAHSLTLPHLPHDLTRALLETRREKLFELVRAIGSPLHFLFPDEMARNLDAFDDVFARHRLRGRVLYAAKANKADGFLVTAARRGAGVDTSSLEEFSAAMAAGVPAAMLSVTGPRKAPFIHEVALRHGATVAIDSNGELLSVLRLMDQGETAEARLLLRFKPDKIVSSRFGMGRGQMLNAIDELAQRRPGVLAGFSFHLSGYSVQERAEATFECCSLIEYARELGLRPDVIDMGGGWPVSYVSHEDWKLFKSSASPGDYHEGRAPSSTYPYHVAVHGAAALEECLNQPQSGRSLAATLHDLGIAVWIEPGRALLAGAGITLFEVQDFKMMEDSYGMTTVTGTSFSLSEQWFQSEFLPDPILVPAGRVQRGDPIRSAVAGSSCLDGDMVTWRKISFPRCPSPGDLICHLNTAGYQMDSNESPFHRVALPEKVTLWTTEEQLNWCLDRHFGNRSHPPHCHQTSEENHGDN